MNFFSSDGMVPLYAIMALSQFPPLQLILYETPAEYSAIHGGDECGVGVKGMQSPST